MSFLVNFRESQLFVRVKYCSLSLLTLGVSNCASAQTDLSPPNPCLNASEKTNVLDLVEQADYIGLFEVEEIKPRDRSDGDPSTTKLDSISDQAILSTDSDEFNLNNKVELPTEPSHLYSMAMRVALKGPVPSKLTIGGSQPPSEGHIPAEFFFIKERHEQIVQAGATIRGTSAVIQGEDGRCIVLQSFKPGYNYLVFGGVVDAAAYEPILSVLYDPLYVEVKKIIQDQNTAR